jgi:dGTPase
MDWADDITFAIHDLVDFFAAGQIPIDRCKGHSEEISRFLSGMFRRKPEWLADKGKYADALDALVGNFPFEPEQRYEDTTEDRARLFEFSTSLIGRYVDSIQVRKPGRSTARLVQIESAARFQVEVLKQFIWEYVILNPDLALPQQGQRKAIRVVFRNLLRAARSGEHHLFPRTATNSLKEARDNPAERVRLVTDYVAGMTERELLRVYCAMQGLSR